MQRYSPPILALALCTTLAACQNLERAMEGHDDVIARADGFALTVDHAARLISKGNPQLLPVTNRMVDPVAEMWVSYTLLASELASGDGLDDIDVSSIAERNLNQALVVNLHRDAIVSRARLSEEEAQESFAEAGPGARRETRHIVVLVPEEASSAERDSLRRRAESIREQLVQGADFADLARRVSQDPASSRAGGNLGWIERGQLVPRLEEVVFDLEPGQISQVVRSEAGFHIVQVTGIQTPDESRRSLYLTQLIQERQREAEDAYIDSLFAAADTAYIPGAASQIRFLARDPRVERLSRVERQAPLATYRGGAVTVGDMADWIIVGAPNTRSTIGGLDDAGIVNNILQEMLRSELLVKAAHDLGYELNPALRDTIMDAARRQLYATVSLSGLRREKLTDDEAIVTAVDSIMVSILRGERSPKPADRIRHALQQGRVVQFYPDRFPRVAERVAAIRGESGGGPARSGAP